MMRRAARVLLAVEVLMLAGLLAGAWIGRHRLGLVPRSVEAVTLVYDVHPSDPARVFDPAEAEATAAAMRMRLDYDRKYGLTARAEGRQVEFVIPLDRGAESASFVEQVKLHVRPIGRLGFHILLTDPAAPQAREMEQRLADVGPTPRAGDGLQWFDLPPTPDGDDVAANATGYGGVVREHGGRRWVLAYATADKSLRHGSAEPWAVQSADPTLDHATGHPVVVVRLDEAGGRAMTDLTGRNDGESLAVVLDGTVLMVATINGLIAQDLVLQGGVGGFTRREANTLANLMSVRPSPVEFAPEPRQESRGTVTLPAGGGARWVLGAAAGALLVLTAVTFMLARPPRTPRAASSAGER